MNFSSDSSEKLILALDGMSKEDALSMIRRIPKLCWVKVGLEMFISSGPEILRELRDLDLKVFLDLKFHDIPITMSKACRQAARTGAELITVHACAGREALKQSQIAVIEGAKESGYKTPTLLAVTVLTSWSPNNFSQELAVNQSINTRVKFFASLAEEMGLGGCVCSPLEAKALRRLVDQSFELVTPGIRPIGDDLGDQARTMSAAEAISAGASRIVVGRPITKAQNPLEVFERFCREIDSV